MHGFGSYTRALRCGFFGICATAVVASGAKAGHPFLTFDAPNAGSANGQGTFATGINGTNSITGYSLDGSNVFHGFVRTSDGTITMFDAPGAGTGAFKGTLPAAIDTAGDVTGYYYDNASATHAFLRTGAGTVETFDIGSDGAPIAINNKGAITGTVGSAAFVRDSGGSVTQFSAPGATLTHPFAINGKGVVAGYYYDGSSIAHGFLRARDGSFVTFSAPGWDNTGASSVNSKGDVAGYAFSGSTYQSFLRTKDGTVTLFGAPGCVSTIAVSIDFDDAIVGYCYENASVTHGFTRKADGTVTTYDVPGVGTTGIASTTPTAIGPNGKSVGYVTDDNGASHAYRLNKGR